MNIGGPMLLEWQETFAVGHAELDAEHQRLLRIINQIHESETGNASSQTPNLLTALYLTAMEHFRHENLLMRDIIVGAYLPRDGCENISEATVNEHCAEHARALIELEGMLHGYASDLRAHLPARLRLWFVDHATKHDAHLRAFFQPK